jgi:hypothetical protein
VEPDPATGDLPSSDSDQPTPYAGTQPLLFGVGIALFTFNPVAVTPSLLHMMAVPQHFPRAVGLAAGLSAIIFLVVSGAFLLEGWEGCLDCRQVRVLVQSPRCRTRQMCVPPCRQRGAYVVRQRQTWYGAEGQRGESER